ncbi:hypothetical protein AB0911_38345 [Streptomyces nigra]|uniref:hypothetical protein n=1 Tax=Streptomyces nigra TaxID=1827580 RepID=UPI0034559DC5
MADFLADCYTRSELFRAWEQASVRFGHDIAHRLAQVTTEIDRAHLYGEIVVGRQNLSIRYSPRGFQAAPPIPAVTNADEAACGRWYGPARTCSRRTCTARASTPPNATAPGCTARHRRGP